MTGKLRLGLAKDNLKQPVANAAVVSIRQVRDQTGRYPSTPFEQTVPMPAGREPAEIDVPFGMYNLAVRLPGGERVQGTVEVGVDAPGTFILNDVHSAYDWLSWQTLAGGAPERQRYFDQVSTAKSRSVSKSLNRGLTADIDGLGYLPSYGRSSLEARDPVTSPHLRVGAGKFSFEDGEIGFDSDFALAWNADSQVDHWELRAPAPVRFRDLTASAGERFFACVQYGNTVTVVVLPVPWKIPGVNGTPDKQGVVDLLLSKTARPDRAVRVAIQEPRFVALLSYLGEGRLSEAAAALGEDLDDQITVLLQDKLGNPFAAAGAAYVGLATTSDPERRQRWSPWLENLMEWFPTLPDGAILCARDRLDRARSRADLDRACIALKQAYRRGIPQYSAGFQHLLNGFQVFADPDAEDLFDDEAKIMRDHVSALAMLVDPTQAFTVLTFPDPD